tara:strand:- start:154 stop:378 length:225 start_codon:yes stop_codon:yes gene_type:complete
LKDIAVGDVVKFVPYYTSSGMQGGSLKLQMPKYDSLALVYKTYVIRGVGHAHIMFPSRKKKVVGFAGLEMVCRL